MMRVTERQPANPITAYQGQHQFSQLKLARCANKFLILSAAAVDSSPLGQALFPPAVTSLLVANEGLIQGTGQSLTWLGCNMPADPSTFATTFPGVQVGPSFCCTIYILLIRPDVM
jgi:hypothetical protein